jgi:hypothetical protein
MALSRQATKASLPPLAAMPAATNDSSVRKETLIAEPQPLLLTPAAYAGLAKLVAFVPGLLMTPATEASRIALGSVLAVSVVVLVSGDDPRLRAGNRGRPCGLNDQVRAGRSGSRGRANVQVPARGPAADFGIAPVEFLAGLRALPVDRTGGGQAGCHAGPVAPPMEGTLFHLSILKRQRRP